MIFVPALFLASSLFAQQLAQAAQDLARTQKLESASDISLNNANKRFAQEKKELSQLQKSQAAQRSQASKELSAAQSLAKKNPKNIAAQQKLKQEQNQMKNLKAKQTKQMNAQKKDLRSAQSKRNGAAAKERNMDKKLAQSKANMNKALKKPDTVARPKSAAKGKAGGAKSTKGKAGGAKSTKGKAGGARKK